MKRINPVYAVLIAVAFVVLTAAGASRYINGTEIPQSVTLLYSSGSQSAALGSTTVTSMSNSGNESITGTIGVTGAATLRSNLTVAGTSALSGAVTTTSTLGVGGALAVAGSAGLSGTLGVSGAATLYNDLTVGDDIVVSDIAASVTADVGSAQGGGAITNTIVRVSTSGTNGDAVTLPAAAAGLVHVVCNHAAANSVDAFPASGDAINIAGANAAIALAAGECMICFAADTTNWGCVIGSAS